MNGVSDDPVRFYERYVEEHVPYHRSPRGLKGFILRFLPYWSYREWRFWRKYVPQGCRLLDLGSARGREIFREKASFCVGVDLAVPALRNCVEHYDGALVGELTALPFADDSFDCVVSSHVMGHVPFEAKNPVLAEIRRVLRPGGVTVHLIETDGDNELIRIAKQNPELYRKYLIEPDGHVGLEKATQVVARFEALGFGLKHVEKIDPNELHPRLVLKWFDNEYRSRSRELDCAVDDAQRVMASSVRLAAKEVRLGWRHRGADQRRGVDEALFLGGVWMS